MAALSTPPPRPVRGKECLRKLVWAQQTEGKEEMIQAKNSLVRKPAQWVLGRDTRLPANLADDAQVSVNARDQISQKDATFSILMPPTKCRAPNCWRGIARVVGGEGSRTIWDSRRSILIAVSPEHLSLAHDQEVEQGL